MTQVVIIFFDNLCYRYSKTNRNEVRRCAEYNRVLNWSNRMHIFGYGNCYNDWICDFSNYGNVWACLK